MNDVEWIALLQQALPRVELRWAGFRKVRRQVCRRLKARLAELELTPDAYRARLEADPAERRVFEGLCRVTISRFGRDRGVFEAVRTRVLPQIAARARAEARPARAWSAGCASGEEPYTLKLLWGDAAVPLEVLATDVDPAVLQRAERACYRPGSLRELAPERVEMGFEPRGGELCLRPELRSGVTFVRHDLRDEPPAWAFDLILCRYLAFTYFDEPLQRRVLHGMLARLRPGGWLVVGTHERVPDTPELEPAGACLFRKREPSPRRPEKRAG